MNKKISALVAIIIISSIFVGYSYLKDENDLDDKSAGSRFFFGKRDFLLDNTKVLGVRTGVESEVIFEVNGFPKQILFNSEINSFLYLDEEDNQKNLVLRDLRGNIKNLAKGNITNDFILSEDAKLVAYKILKQLPEEVLNIDSDLREQVLSDNFMELHVYDIASSSDTLIFKIDPIAEDIVLLEFSNYNQWLIFDRVKESTVVSGELNIFDLENKKIIQSWQAPTRYGQVESPLISPDHKKYVIRTEFFDEEKQEYIYRIVLVGLEKGSESEVIPIRQKSARSIFKEMFWETDSQNLILKIDDSSPDRGVWRINTVTKEKSRLSKTGSVIDLFEDGMVIFEKESESEKISFFVSNDWAEDKRLIVQGEGLFYIGKE